ncbi:MAG: sigma-70 family RNA polymerase sigma factor, partial [Gemmatimonadales bacterium]|nr:sigma-70 family RNA polymerase sigma factor [Gemmatimonadales bacterium]
MSDDSGSGTALAELWEAYRRDRTSEVRELLARHYIGLVHHTAMQLRGRSTDLKVTDLLGAGSLGLLRALERFEPGRGSAFSTYAVQCIRGAILDELRERDRLP